jgi:large-conductance mechanosensitive channel
MSKKFDHKGMMKFAMKVNSDTFNLEILQGLLDSMEDVNLSYMQWNQHIGAIIFMLIDARSKMKKIQENPKLDPETKEKLEQEIDDVLKKINARAKVAFAEFPSN